MVRVSGEFIFLIQDGGFYYQNTTKATGGYTAKVVKSSNEKIQMSRISIQQQY